MAGALGANLTAHQLCKKLIVVRDGSHCVDLGPKDLVDSEFLATIIQDAKTIIKLVGRDRVDGIKSDMVSKGLLAPIPKVEVHSETRDCRQRFRYLRREGRRGVRGREQLHLGRR